MVNSKDYSSSEWNAAWENFLSNKALEKTFERKLTKTPAKVFKTRFKQKNWDKKIEYFCEEIELTYETFSSHQSKVYDAFKDECPELSNNHHKFPVLLEYLLDIFNKSINLSCDKEIQDKRCQYILEPGALIRIKAPSKMGKTRLLNNFLAFADQHEYQTIHVNFLQIESNKFDSLDLFLRWFCMAISYALELETDLDKFWCENQSIQSCTIFLEDVLQACPHPLVLGLDNVDRLLEYHNISKDFYYLLRYCYEEANNNELLEKLRLIVVYSTEDFGSLNINKSPFNVGEVIEPASFNRQQIEELAQQYRLHLSDSEIRQLINLLGGHPYLVDLILSHLAKNSEISLAILLEQAATDIGIYSSFLRQLLFNLRENDQLAQEFLKIIQSKTPIKIDALLAYQLYWMGLIQWSSSGKTVLPFCKLYRLYFLERLSLQESQR
ncbi:MAG: AAA-like domain-containing protein [Cyanobacteria bacterium P01_G01_bin.39]